MLCRRGNRFSLEEQASRNCILPGFRLSLWTGEKLDQDAFHGAPPDYERDGQPDHPYEGSWSEPRENLQEGGCVGAYYRGPFLESVMRFYRRRDDNGNRVSNPALEQCTDWLVHEAVLELENCEESWHAEYAAKRAEMMREQHKQ